VNIYDYFTFGMGIKESTTLGSPARDPEDR
jgi:hypothetical protein